MDGIRQYILSVVAAAIICAILRSILGDKGNTAGMVKLICGLFLAFTVVRPIAEIQIGELALFTDGIEAEARQAVSAGEIYAWESMAAIIKAESEAYILDKAKSLGAELTVEVTVSSDASPVPTAARITGAVSPAAKTQLQTILEEDLGIPKECQIWTGAN